MNIINIEHISKIFGGKVIFDDVSCGISEGEKIGVIGINGTGKTTLLRVLAGLEQPDEGQVITQNGIRIAYLQQNPAFPEEKTVLSYVTDGMWDMDWTLQSEAKSMLNQLGILDHEQPLAELSGGQRRKAALVRTLVQDFDVLLLDEPTNHLDNEMLTWLEDYLNRYKGTVIMVTHDRYFLDRVSNRILELDHGKIYSYEANYSKFLELKVQREEMALATERKRQSVLRMELEWAKRGCRARSTKQRARLERLEALKAGKAPVSDATLEIEATAARMGRKTVELHHISKRYGEKVLIDDFDYIVLKNQRLGIIGPNGCGKSTLIKIIAGLIEPDSGSVEIGETIQLGYFAQEVPDMNTEQRVIDYIKDVAEYLPTKDGKISASQMLERFLFTPEMQYAPVSKLSGGEKKRLYLLKVIFTGANVYLFDELSNDIDIQTLTILEDFLNSFPGIVITVSHDRYFLDNVVDRIFEFDGNGHLQQYEGGYTDYLETKQKRTSQETSESGNALFGKSGKGKSEEGSSKSSRDWKQNRKTKLKFSYKEQKEFETIDDDIAHLEDGIAALEAEILANATNPGKLNELMKEKEKAEHALEEKMNRWVYLNDLAEKIESQKG
ncbi:ATP-binding cassette domain-containing protein [Ruminococcus sp. MCC718]|uniref:ABC-F family ATP-binding cassette domain-containing protein n=1 Tax=Clostridia TaxID=186801 RepID=UPI00156E5F87|nr:MULTISPECIES: ABC-F family ATP-binding cassette domain-containing protein [Clostridia]MBT9653318.1 ATP-binding cassette domain-containing protein [Ruminococcus sp. MCC718]MEE0295892.1 ABC-F family ATP-binding cassette domain-containing protein [Lachnospiraceae bacterium]NSE32855.1 ABC-F family ATP-binding cassette domain-containing protein [Faecalicatena fissicatena]